VVTQIDGATVGIKEAKEYVKARITNKGYSGPGAGEEVMVKALDYTSRGDNDPVEILYAGAKKISVPKKFVEPLEIFENLYETGVYNSETDIQSNPKTSENKPDKTNGVLAAISDKVTEILYGMDDLRTFIKDNSELSHEAVDKAIDDFKSYLTSLDSESEVSASGSVN
jgi:hypothetical protein